MGTDAKRRGRKLVGEAMDLACGHCGQVVLARADFTAIQQMGGVALNQTHPALVKILRRRGGDDYAECPHCHAMHSLVIHADLNGGPALWSLVGLKKVEDPPVKRHWEGHSGGH